MTEKELTAEQLVQKYNVIFWIQKLVGTSLQTNVSFLRLLVF